MGLFVDSLGTWEEFTTDLIDDSQWFSPDFPIGNSIRFGFEYVGIDWSQWNVKNPPKRKSKLAVRVRYVWDDRVMNSGFTWLYPKERKLDLRTFSIPKEFQQSNFQRYLEIKRKTYGIPHAINIDEPNFDYQLLIRRLIYDYSSTSSGINNTGSTTVNTDNNNNSSDITPFF